jgi:hypothetical protein
MRVDEIYQEGETSDAVWPVLFSMTHRDVAGDAQGWP